MSRQTRGDGRTGAGQDEMVVSVDQRLLGVVGIVVLAALGGTIAWWSASRGGGTEVAQLPAGDPNAAATQAVIDAMRAVGIDPTLAGPVSQVVTVAAPTSVPGAPPQMVPIDQVTPRSPAEATQMALPGANAIIDRPNSVDASQWSHDVLQNFPDPNVTDPKYSATRIEDVKAPIQGPSLAIGDLNDLISYDYGVVPGDVVAKHDFRVKNAGTQELLISRVYTGCGCTATKIKDYALDAAGWVVNGPLSLAPGEETTFTVEYDPRVEAGQGGRARHKFVQVYSNDPTKAIFDPAVANQHESRFRIVIEPRYGYTAEQIATQEAVAQATKDANKKELAP